MVSCVRGSKEGEMDRGGKDVQRVRVMKDRDGNVLTSEDSVDKVEELL